MPGQGGIKKPVVISENVYSMDLYILFCVVASEH